MERWARKSFANVVSPPPITTWAIAGVLGVAAVFAVGQLLGVDPAHETALYALAWIVGLAVAPLAVAAVRASLSEGLRVIVSGALAITLYFAWHRLFGEAVTIHDSGEPSWLRLGIVTATFTLLFGVQAAVSSHPSGALSRALHPVLFGGLYLDELLTRLTFRWWPPRLPDPEARRNSPLLSNVEA